MIVDVGWRIRANDDGSRASCVCEMGSSYEEEKEGVHFRAPS
jgi:hypothetical protein